MKWASLLIWLLAIIATTSCHKTDKAAYEAEVLQTSSGTQYLAHEVIVKKTGDTTFKEFESAINAKGGSIVDADSKMATQLGFYRVTLPQEVTADVLISELMSKGITEAAERNYMVNTNIIPNDPQFSEQWNLAVIDAEKAWNVTTGSEEMIVAVSDSGIDFEHEDLVANIWTNPDEIPNNGIDDDNNGYIDDMHGWDWKNQDADPADDGGHGTAVSGVIGAIGNNAQGIAGLNWNVKIMPLKFINSSGSGSLWDAAESILYAAEKNVKIVNASWGCSGCYSDYFVEVLNKLEASGGILVAAAGNDKKNIDHQPTYPAAYGNANIITVGASWKQDTPFDYSNWGKMNVDVVAPGRNIPTTTIGGGYEVKSGTSLAAPHAAGVLALYWSIFPNASVDTVKQRLIATCDHAPALKNKSLCEGRINAYRMLTDDDEPPLAPENLIVEPGNKNNAILTWNPINDPGLAMYICKWGNDSGQYSWEATVPSTETTMTIPDLEDGATYYFVCLGADKSGNVSPPSNEARIVPNDTEVPPQVIDLRATPLPGPRASGAVYAASGEASAFYQAENAYDGSIQTAWLAVPSEQQEEEYLVVDFNLPTTIDRVALSPVAAYPEFFPQDFDIELSLDGSSWQVVAGMRNMVVSDASQIVEVMFPPTLAEHMRLTIHSTTAYESGLQYTGIAEIEAFETSTVPDSVELLFVSPGDDPGYGKPESYDIRYSTSPITIENFLQANTYASPLPSASGVLERVVVDNLQPETTYWFALIATDEVGNRSPISNIAVASTAVVLPGTITNLEVIYTDNINTQLTWNAPGSNGYEDQASAYDLRWSVAPITAGNFDSAAKVTDITTPLTAGTNEMFDITHLQHTDQFLHFAIAAVDDNGHRGGISNVVKVKPQYDMLDDIPPATVDNLQAFDSLQRVTLYGEVIESSSHMQDAYNASNLLDRDVLTMWMSEQLPPTLPEWVVVDFGEPKSINQFRLHPAVFGNMIANFPRDYQIQVSADNVNYESIVAVTGQAAELGKWLEYNFDTVSARYVKMDVSLRGFASCNEPTQCNQPSSVVMSELEIKGPTSDLDVELVWIAPGDDLWQGDAFAYDLRHSLEPITELSFVSETQIPIAAPLEGGMFEVRTIAKLDWGHPHYFALKAVDASGNWSPMSNVALLNAPLNPPAPVTNLTATSVTKTSVELNWTAVGDNGLQGQATSYDLRYSTQPIHKDNWHLADIVFNMEAPAISGEVESIVLNNLKPATDYFFVLRVGDDEGSQSLFSNMVYAQTITDIPPTQVSDLQAIAIDYSDEEPLPLVVIQSSGAYTDTATAAMLVDGNLDSAWLSPQQETMSNEYVEFSLDQPTLISDIRILPATGYEDMFPVDFSIQMKTGSNQWQTVAQETSFYVDDNNADWEQWSVGAVIADSIRLEITRTQPSSFGYFAAISEVEVVENPSKFDTIELSWTAPTVTDGQPGAAAYDLRTAPIAITDDDSFNTAASIGNVQSPKIAKMPEFFAIDGLLPETQYCFAIEATDLIGNTSGLSNSACAYTPGVPPATVVNLAIKEISTNSAILTWSAPGADWNVGTANRYDVRVFKQRINKDSFEEAFIIVDVPHPSASGQTEQLEVTGLEGDTQYYFALKTYDTANNSSGISNNAIATTGDNVPPLAITDLIAQTDFENWGTLLLTWSAPGNSGPIGQAAAYDIRVSASPITSANFEGAQPISLGEFVPAAAGSTEAFSITGLLPEEEYFIAIKARDDGGNWSALSNIPEARTRDEIPGTTIDLEVVETTSYELGDATVLLQWTAPGDDNHQGIANRYEFRYSTDAITPENFESATLATVDLIPAPAATVQMTTINGLDEGMNYCFAFRAVDERDNIGLVSNSACTTTADGVAPSTIWDLSAETGYTRGTIDLTWTHPGDDAMFGKATAYDLRWSYDPIDGNNFDTANQSVNQPAPKTAGTTASFTATNLPDEVLLHFAIKAVDDVGNGSDVSNDAPARTPDVAPAAIDDLAQTGIELNSIPIGWTAVGDDEYIGTATGYDLRYSSEPIHNGNFDAALSYPIAAPQLSGSSESATIDGLLEGTTYYIAIKTVDDRGNWSPISTLLIAHTQDTVPPGQINPLDIQEGVKAGSLRLDWIATGDDGDMGTATLYEIRYAFECIEESSWATATPVENTIKPRPSGSLELFNAEGLEGETIYYFAIRAVDEVGNVGLISPCVFGETAPVAPDKITDLTGVAIRPRSVVLDWTAPFDVGTLGQAVEYDIRYATFKLTENNFYSAPRFNDAPIPQSPGIPQTATVPNLNESTLYYFAIKSIDDKGAVSAMSNVAQVITLDETPPAAPPSINANTTHSFTGLIPAVAATVSSQLVDILGAQNLIDADSQSMWVSDASSIPTEEWAMIDLGVAAEIDRIRLLPNPEYIHLFPQNFVVSVSTDNETWTDVLTVEQFEAHTDSWMTFGFNPHGAQYIKVTSYDPVKSYFGLYYTVLGGMEVFGAAPLSGRTTLTWTAPGDDEMIGIATYYEVFYSESPFTADSLDSASSMVFGLEPLPAYSSRALTFSGFKGETRYYWALRAVDEAENIGEISEVVTAMSGDANPARVTDLRNEAVAMTTIDLAWTTTGDDGWIGTATSFELRYAPWSLTLENFPFATEVISMPVPQIAGSTQSVSVADLSPDTLYRFAIVVIDEKGASSYLSNVLSVKTDAAPDAIAPAAITDLSAHVISSDGQKLYGAASNWTSEQAPDHVANNLADGDTGTAWVSAAQDASIEQAVVIDLGAVYPVGEMRLWPADDFVHLFPLGVEVNVSVDGLKWSTVFAQSDYVAHAGQALESVFPVTAMRYVEVVATELAINDNDYYYAVIAELELIHAQSDPGTMVVTWSATGDDDQTGTATRYHLRYSDCPFDNNAATKVITFTPNEFGTAELARITDPSEGTYCIGITAVDEAENEGPLSNIVEIYTPGE